jgi:hypothetical protein
VFLICRYSLPVSLYTGSLYPSFFLLRRYCTPGVSLLLVSFYSWFLSTLRVSATAYLYLWRAPTWCVLTHGVSVLLGIFAPCCISAEVCFYGRVFLLPCLLTLKLSTFNGCISTLVYLYPGVSLPWCISTLVYLYPGVSLYSLACLYPSVFLIRLVSARPTANPRAFTYLEVV